MMMCKYLHTQFLYRLIFVLWIDTFILCEIITAILKELFSKLFLHSVNQRSCGGTVPLAGFSVTVRSWWEQQPSTFVGLERFLEDEPQETDNVLQNKHSLKNQTLYFPYLTVMLVYGSVWKKDWASVILVFSVSLCRTVLIKVLHCGSWRSEIWVMGFTFFLGHLAWAEARMGRGKRTMGQNRVRGN